MNIIVLILSIYIIGCILGLFIYEIIIYEKYNNKLFKDYNKKDIISGTFILFSWFYLVNLIFKLKNINFNCIMKIIKKIEHKILEAYKEGVEMIQYEYYRV